MPIVCLQCDETPPGVVAGAPCPACGAAVVDVKRDDDLIGTVIDGRFEITGLLGRGGMGAVYRAVQRSIGREVALKLMEQRTQDTAAAKRFFREAKLASKLAHPNTVAVIEFGQDHDGSFYLVMELVAGRTLHETLAADGAFAMPRIVRIGTQLCDALEAAHALGIVHRDLKPDNIIIGERDRVTVLDFGLALMVDDPGMRATAAGVYAGTPRYMAPEIAIGAEPTASQDIYALGVILAELATNRQLFSAPTIESLFVMKQTPDGELGGLPIELRALVERMVSPDVADRPTAAEVRARLTKTPPAFELDRTASAPVIAPPPPPSAAFRPPEIVGAGLELEAGWKRDKQNPPGHINQGQPKKSSGALTGVVILLLVAGGGVGVWWWQTHKAKPPPVAEVLPPAKNTVAIHIIASPPIEVTLDGKRAGKTPFTIDHARTTQPIVIGNGTRFVEVVPDRDREVDVSP